MSQNKYPDSLPNEYRPLGAWAYFGYTLLFSLPFVGLILAIVFSFNEENLHRKSFARSIVLLWIISIVIYVLFFILFRAMVLR